MNQNCSKCDTTIPDERIHLGYKECVSCSEVEPYSAHVVYPHKTGAFVQPVSSETKKNLDRLDRRAVKVGDTIVYTKFSATEIQHKNVDYSVVTERDIIAIVED